MAHILQRLDKALQLQKAKCQIMRIHRRAHEGGKLLAVHKQADVLFFNHAAIHRLGAAMIKHNIARGERAALGFIAPARGRGWGMRVVVVDNHFNENKNKAEAGCPCLANSKINYAKGAC